MILKELVEGLDILEICGDINANITNIAYDSRKVRNDTLFVCIEGFKVDGHQFVAAAIENGVKALLVQKNVSVPEGITVIRVADTRLALAHVSNAFFENPSDKFTLFGITGTKGKTTTTFMIKSILEKVGQKVGLIGTVANFIGNETIPTERTTPESYDLQALFGDMVEKNVNSVVMEVSSHALELHRVSCCNYDIGVFTNLTQDHLDFHETFENYFNAKMKLFKMCSKALINIDSDYGERAWEAASAASGKVYTFGIHKEADFKAVNIVTNPDSVEFDLVSMWGNGHLKVNIPGVFTVYNALAAIGCCILGGISLDDIREGLLNTRVPGRAEVVYTNDKFTVIIDYAHSPDSLENILKTIKDYSVGRVVCLFGCGGDRDRTKRPIMGEISGRLADLTIITSDNPRTEEPESIVRDIEEGIKRTDGAYITIVDRREAIKYSLENAQKGDIILLAGKGHETYQIFKDKTIHFDEREVVLELLDLC
ncbi:UDP-N-acetylmuramoyl-L-alanyl-D-glutamate--2,6-diaminopimelate ligase [Pseudobacteroides cellulosolvens]|uniref:UDP-N-acetylmuramoyl-L-alanyl-D-glutamate--2,6-diaminopimelate ligase n=1 Tax=Pseudobacteroides cellulosolvens ATCC 35603 = DSM 2933 TaxID=398512 RepID=A0A0L6JGV6_9FIRM|nr:UDP-N-acetylmuramoyl-L-alanyl-D-glutamate--2,6-diaminopimelate ligase [Pseudobacteroides cellulosolvens]KNY24940.1 UDP-N-acetylmuramoyl-L-alanyl-D-glutamate--2,6-diaminopimelate ligase [Pseudobacteroides cellulosolvens ATCC 35603 = DSM 2933]